MPPPSSTADRRGRMKRGIRVLSRQTFEVNERGFVLDGRLEIPFAACDTADKLELRVEELIHEWWVTVELIGDFIVAAGERLRDGVKPPGPTP